MFLKWCKIHGCMRSAQWRFPKRGMRAGSGRAVSRVLVVRKTK